MKRANEQVRTKAYQGYQQRATFLIEGHQETFTVYAKSPYRLIIAIRRRRRRRRRKSDRRCYIFTLRSYPRRELFPPRIDDTRLSSSLTVRTAFLKGAPPRLQIFQQIYSTNEISSRRILFPFFIFSIRSTTRKGAVLVAISFRHENENAREKNNCRPRLFLFLNSLRVLSSFFSLFSLIRSNPTEHLSPRNETSRGITVFAVVLAIPAPHFPPIDKLNYPPSSVTCTYVYK